MRWSRLVNRDDRSIEVAEEVGTEFEAVTDKTVLVLANEATVGDAHVVADECMVGDARVVVDETMVGDARVVVDGTIVGDTCVVVDEAIVGDVCVVVDKTMVSDACVVATMGKCVVVDDTDNTKGVEIEIAIVSSGVH